MEKKENKNITTLLFTLLVVVLVLSVIGAIIFLMNEADEDITIPDTFETYKDELISIEYPETFTFESESPAIFSIYNREETITLNATFLPAEEVFGPELTYLEDISIESCNDFYTSTTQISLLLAAFEIEASTIEIGDVDACEFADDIQTVIIGLENEYVFSFSIVEKTNATESDKETMKQIIESIELILSKDLDNFSDLATTSNRDIQRKDVLFALNLRIVDSQINEGVYPEVTFNETLLTVAGEAFYELKDSNRAVTGLTTPEGTAYCYEIEPEGSGYKLAYQNEEGEWIQFGSVDGCTQNFLNN